LHDFVIRHDGLRVYPRLVAAEHKRSYARDRSKRHPQLDKLLGAGSRKAPARSSSAPPAPASRRSPRSSSHAAARAASTRPSTCSTKASRRSSSARRASARCRAARAIGLVSLRQVDPAELLPGEFAHSLRDAVENEHADLVVIDSLNGYLNATPGEKFLTLHLHELLTYLGQCGVTTLLLMTQHGIVGSEMAVPVDASYLADSVMSLRYFEARAKSGRPSPSSRKGRASTSGPFASCGSTKASRWATSCGSSRVY
jgi:circadian clock protein KaiC